MPNTDLKTVLVVSRSDPEHRFDKPWRGEPVASFTLEKGKISVQNHSPNVPFLIEEAKHYGLTNPLTGKRATMKDGVVFLYALLAQIGTASYLTAYALDSAGRTVDVDLPEEEVQ